MNMWFLETWRFSKLKSQKKKGAGGWLGGGGCGGLEHFLLIDKNRWTKYYKLSILLLIPKGNLTSLQSKKVGWFFFFFKASESQNKTKKSPPVPVSFIFKTTK